MTQSTIDLDAIKRRIAKLLRMQGSSNENEAANAVEFVERLCRDYGLTPKEILDFEKEPDQEITLREIRTSTSPADRWLWHTVAKHFDCTTVWEEGLISIFGTEAGQLQTEVYAEYLFEERTKLEQAARLLARSRGHSLHGFAASFGKAFAMKIGERLRAIKQRQHNEGLAQTAGQNAVPGLVLQRRSEQMIKRAEGIRNLKYPSLRKSKISVTRNHAFVLGTSAASSVSLDKQMNGATRRRLGAGA